MLTKLIVTLIKLDIHYSNSQIIPFSAGPVRDVALVLDEIFPGVETFAPPLPPAASTLPGAEFIGTLPGTESGNLPGVELAVTLPGPDDCSTFGLFCVTLSCHHFWSKHVQFLSYVKTVNK